MTQVSDGGKEEAPDRRADPEPGRHRRTVDRAIPRRDARQQSPHPFRPVVGEYREGARVGKINRESPAGKLAKV